MNTHRLTKAMDKLYAIGEGELASAVRDAGEIVAAWNRRPAPPAAKAAEMDALDTKRLDWLDQQHDLLFDCYMQDGKATHIIRQHWGRPLGHGPTPRAAIDAAMSAQGGKG